MGGRRCLHQIFSYIVETQLRQPRGTRVGAPHVPLHGCQEILEQGVYLYADLQSPLARQQTGQHAGSGTCLTGGMSPGLR